MPRFRVVERRSYISTMLIEAESEEDAKTLTGEIIDEHADESWSDELRRVVQVDDDEDEA